MTETSQAKHPLTIFVIDTRDGHIVTQYKRLVDVPNHRPMRQHIIETRDKLYDHLTHTPYYNSGYAFIVLDDLIGKVGLDDLIGPMYVPSMRTCAYQIPTENQDDARWMHTSFMLQKQILHKD